MRPLLACFVAMVLCGCSASSASKDEETPIGLPQRSDKAEEGTPLQPEPGSPLETEKTPASTTCKAEGLALCFRFEDVVTDEAPSPLTPLAAVGIAFAAGHEGRAATFSGMSALRFGASPVLELTANATIEAWISREDTGANAVVFDDDGRFSLTIDANGTLLCQTSSGGVLGTTVIPTSTWTHVACVVDGATVHAYVDGVEQAAGPGGVLSFPSGGAAIGGNAPDGDPFVGAIDSLRVFATARTKDEIAAAR